jgi:hypothetical protein
MISHQQPERKTSTCSFFLAEGFFLLESFWPSFRTEDLAHGTELRTHGRESEDEEEDEVDDQYGDHLKPSHQQHTA